MFKKHLVSSIGVVFLAGLSGCFKHEPSNAPDSGIACNSLSVDAGGVDPKTPAGSGTVTGDLTFTAKASLQSRNTTLKVNDPTTWISFDLYDEAISCNERYKGKPNAVAVDGGTTPATTLPSPVLTGYLYDLGRDQFPVGTYTLGADAGMKAELHWFENSATDPNAVAVVAKQGVINLTSVEPCSISGTFTGTFDGADGGSRVLNGSFTSAYCE